MHSTATNTCYQLSILSILSHYHTTPILQYHMKANLMRNDNYSVSCLHLSPANFFYWLAPLNWPSAPTVLGQFVSGRHLCADPHCCGTSQSWQCMKEWQQCATDCVLVAVSCLYVDILWLCSYVPQLTIRMYVGRPEALENMLRPKDKIRPREQADLTVTRIQHNAGKKGKAQRETEREREREKEIERERENIFDKCWLMCVTTTTTATATTTFYCLAQSLQAFIYLLTNIFHFHFTFTALCVCCRFFDYSHCYHIFI